MDERIKNKVVEQTLNDDESMEKLEKDWSESISHYEQAFRERLMTCATLH